MAITAVEAVVQTPVPTLGLLPAKIAVVVHTLWSVPATEVEGLASLVIVTVLSLTAQPPLEIVHLNTFAPTPKLDTPVLLAVASANVPVPLTTLHKPVPIPGLLPAKVAVGKQTF